MRMRHENVYTSHLETIPNLTSDSVAEKRQNNRKILLQILSNIRCLNKDCFLLPLDIADDDKYISFYTKRSSWCKYVCNIFLFSLSFKHEQSSFLFNGSHSTVEVRIL